MLLSSGGVVQFVARQDRLLQQQIRRAEFPDQAQARELLHDHPLFGVNVNMPQHFRFMEKSTRAREPGLDILPERARMIAICFE